MTLNQVRVFSVWFMGDESSSLATSANMKIKATNPNVVGNLGLVNQYEIQTRQLSGAIHFIFKYHVKRTSYTSFQPNNNKFI